MKTLNPTAFPFLILMALFAALPPFALDTYTPAIPSMAAEFHLPQARVILSVSSYLMGFAFGMLIWGPLSDVIGRRLVIRLGLVIYLIATFSSALSLHLNELVFWRFFQAIGDSAGVGVAFTMLRDIYSGRHLTKIMSTIIAMMMIAPMIAPLIGSLLLIHYHWHSVFYFLFCYGVFLMGVSFFLPETLSFNNRIKVRSVLSQYVIHFSNKQFLLLALCVSLSFAATFSFISSASVIYMSIYHLNKFSYSALFAFNGLAIIAGSLTLRALSAHKSPLFIQTLGLSIFCLSDIVLLVVLVISPHHWPIFTALISVTTFGLCLLIGSFMSGAMNSVSAAFGTATSIVNSSRNLLGSFSSMLMSIVIVHSAIPLMIIQLSFCIGIASLLYVLRPMSLAV